MMSACMLIKFNISPNMKFNIFQHLNKPQNVHVHAGCSHLLLVLVHDVVLLFIQLVQLLPQPATALLYVLRRKAA